MPGRWCCLMAMKVVALSGNWLSGKSLLAATGAVGLLFKCSPVARLKRFSLLHRQGDQQRLDGAKHPRRRSQEWHL